MHLKNISSTKTMITKDGCYNITSGSARFRSSQWDLLPKRKSGLCSSPCYTLTPSTTGKVFKAAVTIFPTRSKTTTSLLAQPSFQENGQHSSRPHSIADFDCDIHLRIFCIGDMYSWTCTRSALPVIPTCGHILWSAAHSEPYRRTNADGWFSHLPWWLSSWVLYSMRLCWKCMEGQILR